MLAHWTDHFVDVNGSRFHYVRSGHGDKPALVLAHGYSDSGLCWSALAQALEADWDVILPDARGHGLSQRVSAGETIDLAADLAGVIQAIGLDRPVVGGHSMGGSTAAELGARFPQCARALILEDPAWFDPQQQASGPAAENADQTVDPYEQWRSQMSDFTVAGLMAQSRRDNPTWREEELQNWAESKLQLDPEFVRGSHRLVLWGTWQKAAQAITQPTLLITADPAKGSIVTEKIAQQVMEWSPCIQVAHIAGVGHCIRREAPEAYLAALRAFLGKI